MQFDTIREQHHTAAYLPSPLYVLYMQATAYAEACGLYTQVKFELCNIM
jgi:THO complex subunit 5